MDRDTISGQRQNLRSTTDGAERGGQGNASAGTNTSEGTNERQDDRRNRQRHQRATATAGVDPAGLVLDGNPCCLGGWAVESGSVDTLSNSKGRQVGSDEKDEQLAASA